MIKTESYLKTLKDIAQKMRQESFLHEPASELLANLEKFVLTGSRPRYQELCFPCFAFSLDDTRESIGKRGDADLIIGGYLYVDESNTIARQSICVTILFRPAMPAQVDKPSIAGKGQSSGEVVRRFHFDYDSEVAEDETKEWPVAHLQYGGKHDGSRFPECWSGAQYRLFSKIDRPRLLSPPLDFVLVTDLFVRQFGPKDGMKILNDGTWTKATLTAQRLFMRPYLKRMADHQLRLTDSYYKLSSRVKENISFC